jgi:aspartyl-tRNA(Asn)/glutamyl-tRNA(Gln) amidotransferase subunit A
MTPETVRGISDGVRSGDVSAERVVEERLARLEAGRELGGVLHVATEAALERAREIDRRRSRGEPLGPLAGVPVGIKDNICVEGWPTTCGSRLLEGWTAPYDATAVRRLREADAIPVAKTSCDEFGMGSSNERCAFGPARHPRDPGRVPGGSSGGSAVVVADRQLPAALGSDTGGSVRQPAALCGVVGAKPTYGRVSRFGLVAYASSLDQIGPITRDVEDAELLLRVLGGHDPRDATSLDEPWPEAADGDVPTDGPLRFGVLEEFLEADELHPAAAAAVERAGRALRESGHLVETASLPEARGAIPIYYVLAGCEASSNLARFDGVRFGRQVEADGGPRTMVSATRGWGFGPEVKRRVLLGTFALSAGYRDAFYLRALAGRQRLAEKLGGLWRRFDLLLTPTVPQPAFPLGDKLDDPVAMYGSDVFTILANVCGVPAITLPAPEGVEAPCLAEAEAGPNRITLPLGVQLLGMSRADRRVLAAARELEAAGFRAEV